MGRSRRSTPRPGKPVTWRRAAAGLSAEGLECREDVGEYRRVAPWHGLCWAGRAAGTEIQTKLHRWANDDPHRRFDDLFNLVYDPAFLVMAWERVAGNRGARSAGVDGMTVAFDPRTHRRGVTSWTDLRESLKSGDVPPATGAANG